MKYTLINSDNDKTIFQSDCRLTMQRKIIETLSETSKTLELYRRHECPKDRQKYYGDELIEFYKNNSKGYPCRIIFKGDREYLKTINPVSI